MSRVMVAVDGSDLDGEVAEVIAEFGDTPTVTLLVSSVTDDLLDPSTIPVRVNQRAAES